LFRIHLKESIAATVVLLLAIATQSSAQLETRSSSPIIYDPISVTTGDFNHDGKMDVAVAASYTGQIAVLMGNGDGTFQPAVYYSIDTKLESIDWVVAADFRTNGNLDLVAADDLGENISVLLGNGDGTFQSPVQYSTSPYSPTYVAVGDFNGDGTPDIVLADGQLSVMLSNGDGTFQPPIDNSIFIPAGYQPLALGDFNRDGNVDVAMVKAFEPELGILLGNGDGTFREGAQYAVGEFGNSITVGDFNGDHRLDLAVTNGIGNQVYILLGNGDGTFRSKPPFSISEPAAIASVDVNGDGKLDLLFITQTFPSGLTELAVMLGNGNGTFQRPVNYPSFVTGGELAIGDFNGDHKPDVAVADERGQALDVLLNTGVVSFSPTTPISFNPQLLGSTSAAQKITLTNTGSTALSITSKQASQPFQLASGTTCGSSVAPGAKCALSAAFHPTATGFKSGVLQLNDSASSKPQAIELSGTGTTLTVSPSKLNFGQQPVGQQSDPQTVTVKNVGSAAVSVTGISITGPSPLAFPETNTCGTQIAPGATCTISISFLPLYQGPISTLAVIDGPDGAVWQQIQLTGTGI